MNQIYQLLVLELDEISLVDNPANEGSVVTLFKVHTPMTAADQSDGTSSWAELSKAASDQIIKSTMTTAARF